MEFTFVAGCSHFKSLGTKSLVEERHEVVGQNPKYELCYLDSLLAPTTLALLSQIS